jgi:hypothetical protein
MDKLFLDFTGTDPEALKKELAAGKGDGEILEWIEKNARIRRSAPEIAAWTAYVEQRTPGNPDGRDFLNGLHKGAAPKREDIHTFFDVLDVDDYVSYGGKA